jgi:hypothetical protein
MMESTVRTATATIRMAARDFSVMDDMELFSLIEWYGNEDFDACKKEKDRRVNEKREEQDRIEQERFLRLNAIKENLTYSDKLAQTICERISAGELLTVLCREDDMPTMRRCNQWLKEHAEFQALMDMSKNDRLNIFEEEVIEIADDMKNDFKTVIKTWWREPNCALRSGVNILNLVDRSVGATYRL